MSTSQKFIGEIMIFQNKLKKAFRAVRRDMNVLRYGLNEWTIHLDTNQRQLLDRVKKLEKKVKELELDTAIIKA